MTARQCGGWALFFSLLCSAPSRATVWSEPTLKELFARPVIVVATVQTYGLYTARVRIDEWLRGETARFIYVRGFNNLWWPKYGIRNEALYPGDRYLLFLKPPAKIRNTRRSGLVYTVPTPTAGHFKLANGTTDGNLFGMGNDNEFTEQDLLVAVRLGVRETNANGSPAERFGSFRDMVQHPPLAAHDQETMGRLHLAMALLALQGRPEESIYLDPLLQDPEMDIRHTAILALGQMEGQQVVDRLIRLLTDPNPTLAATAARQLRVLNNPRAIPGLRRALSTAPTASPSRDIMNPNMRALNAVHSEIRTALEHFVGKPKPWTFPVGLRDIPVLHWNYPLEEHIVALLLYHSPQFAEQDLRIRLDYRQGKPNGADGYFTLIPNVSEYTDKDYLSSGNNFYITSEQLNHLLAFLHTLPWENMKQRYGKEMATEFPPFVVIRYPAIQANRKSTAVQFYTVPCDTAAPLHQLIELLNRIVIQNSIGEDLELLEHPCQDPATAAARRVRSTTIQPPPHPPETPGGAQ